LRIGTPATTTQGMRETEMTTIGALIHRVLVGREDAAQIAAVREEVVALCDRFVPYP
jgi:glycine hydroxymethyltransferase